MPGMLLGKKTSGGTYSHYDNDATDGTEDAENCIVLLEIIDDISTGNQQAAAGVGGVLRRDELRFVNSTAKTAFLAAAELAKAPFNTI